MFMAFFPVERRCCAALYILYETGVPDGYSGTRNCGIFYVHSVFTGHERYTYTAIIARVVSAARIVEPAYCAFMGGEEGEGITYPEQWPL
jgi:hypothetical protein